jgi:preprotein translocase subunit YajC
MNALAPGDRVMLASGLFGTVVSVGSKQVVIEISPGAELTVLKQAISRIVTADDEDNVEEHDELEEEDTADAMTEEPRELQSERLIEEPPAANGPQPTVEPDSATAPDSNSQPPTERSR